MLYAVFRNWFWGILISKEGPNFFGISVFQKSLNAIKFQQRLRNPLCQQEHKLKKAHQNKNLFFVHLVVAPLFALLLKKKKNMLKLWLRSVYFIAWCVCHRNCAWKRKRWGLRKWCFIPTMPSEDRWIGTSGNIRRLFYLALHRPWITRVTYFTWSESIKL